MIFEFVKLNLNSMECIPSIMLSRVTVTCYESVKKSVT